MTCPKCKGEAAEVIGSKKPDKKSRIRRRYTCMKCKYTFPTLEVPTKFFVRNATVH